MGISENVKNTLAGCLVPGMHGPQMSSHQAYGIGKTATEITTGKWSVSMTGPRPNQTVHSQVLVVITGQPDLSLWLEVSYRIFISHRIPNSGGFCDLDETVKVAAGRMGEGELAVGQSLRQFLTQATVQHSFHVAKVLERLSSPVPV